MKIKIKPVKELDSRILRYYAGCVFMVKDCVKDNMYELVIPLQHKKGVIYKINKYNCIPITGDVGLANNDDEDTIHVKLKPDKFVPDNRIAMTFGEFAFKVYKKPVFDSYMLVIPEAVDNYSLIHKVPKSWVDPVDTFKVQINIKNLINDMHHSKPDTYVIIDVINSDTESAFYDMTFEMFVLYGKDCVLKRDCTLVPFQKGIGDDIKSKEYRELYNRLEYIYLGEQENTKKEMEGITTYQGFINRFKPDNNDTHYVGIMETLKLLDKPLQDRLNTQLQHIVSSLPKCTIHINNRLNNKFKHIRGVK